MFSGTPWRALIVLIGTVTQLATAVPTHAQGLPQIVWMTNAHGGPLTAIAISRNGVLATGANDYRLKLWRISDGVLLHDLTNHTAYVETATFSQDGHLLAVSAASHFDESDNLIKLWRVADGQGVRTISGGSRAVAFSADGTLLAAQRGGEFGWIDFYAVSDGSFLRQTSLMVGSMGSLAFSPDGRFLAASGAYLAAVWIYQVSDASEQRVILDGPKGVVYTPDGKYLVLPGSGGSLDGIIGMVDPETGIFDRPFVGHRSPVQQGALTGDGKRLVSASGAQPPNTFENGIRVWRVANRKPIAIYDLGVTIVRSLAASPNNRFFAYGTHDGTVVVARMPVQITLVKRDSGQTVVEWEGSSGPYQLQQRTNLSTDVWHNLGEPTMALAATNSTTAPAFYRVQDLGNQ